MRLKRKKRSWNGENLIPLINIVFLMLIFFLAAGTLRPFEEENIKPAEANFTNEAVRPSGPVLLSAEGQITIDGVEQDEASLTSILQSRVAAGITSPLPVVADRNLAAGKLVEVIETAKTAGIEKIRLVTRRRTSP